MFEDIQNSGNKPSLILLINKELKENKNPTFLRSFNPFLGYHLTCIPEKQPHGRVIFPVISAVA